VSLPRFPTDQLNCPAAVTTAPSACSPSMIGEFVYCASHITLSRLIWHLVLPDLVLMVTYPYRLWNNA
jgi:hypothetical protein